MNRRRYIRPEAFGLYTLLPEMLCDSLTGTDIDDFTESEEIEW